jgi:hypothetical protein
MFHSFIRRHKSSARRRLMPELDLLEIRLTPSGTVNYTNLAVSGAVTVPPPANVGDITIKFSATAPLGSSFTLNENAHDVTILGGIPNGADVTLNGNVNNVTIQGDVSGNFQMLGNGNDVKMGAVHGFVEINLGTIHDFTAGEIFDTATFEVADPFHDGTLGPEDSPFSVVITGPHHSLTIRS